jgi:hypothetical protein
MIKPTTMPSHVPTTSWLRFTILSGIAAMVSYAAAAFVPLPEKISLLLAFAFGPFFMLASLGYFHIIRAWKDSIALQVGVLFNIVGTSLVTLMLVVQQTSFTFHDRFKTERGDAFSETQLSWVFKEVNAVQLGIDLAWDLFISAGTVFLAIGMWNHPVYRKVFPLTGILVAVLLFSFNMAYFPVPPSEAGSVDFGPFVALWYLALTIWTWIHRAKISSLAVR